MANITAAMVKELREMTGAGMMECKKALAEAEDKATKEKAAHEKHEARLDEVQQELQDAVKKCESLERDVSARETELAKARQSAEEARVEAQGAL